MIQKHFNSVESLIQYAQTSTDAPGHGPVNQDERAQKYLDIISAPSWESEHTRDRAEWVGVPFGTTWADLRRMFATGDAAEVDRLREEVARIDLPPLKSVRRRGVWSDQGEELNRDRLYGGQVDSCWRTARRQMTQGVTHVRIIAHVGGYGAASAESVFYSAAGAVALTEALVTAGYEVELLAATTVKDGIEKPNEDLTVSAIVKTYGAPLALAPCLAVMGSRFYRTVMFATFCRIAGHLRRPVSKGMGGHAGDGLEVRNFPGTSQNVRTITLPRSFTREKVNAAVRNAVKELTGEEAAPAASAPVPRVDRPPQVGDKVRLAKSPGRSGYVYTIAWMGQTKYGYKAKLTGPQGETSWAKVSDLIVKYEAA